MAAASGLDGEEEEKRLLIEVEDFGERDELGRMDDDSSDDDDEMSTDLGRGLLRDPVGESSLFGFLLGEAASSRLVRVKARLRGRDREGLASFKSSSSRLRGLLLLLLSLLSASALVGVAVEEVDDPLPPRWFWISFNFMRGSSARIWLRMFGAMFLASSRASRAELISSSLMGLNSSGWSWGVESACCCRDLKLSVPMAASTLDVRLSLLSDS